MPVKKMKLVIVESPTKEKTIQGFLGKEFKTTSSYGHVRDLPKSKLGVDLENNFQPNYIIPTKKRKVISSLKKEAEKSDEVILATDEDREGEAIAWHLSEVLKLEDPQRIVFHEITKPAIEESLRNPRKIDPQLVNAQQARRVLDRVVGYKLSPFLWKKVARGLSAGRVQSVALRLINDREKEIKNFNPQEYWKITALFEKGKEFEGILIKKGEKAIPKMGIKSQTEANKILEELREAKYKVEKVDKKETKKNPLPPFTTSTLQQDAWAKLRFPARLTMSVAQQLYERGFITYHRTDSLNLSNSSLAAAKKVIGKKYGEKFWAGYYKRYKARGKTQEAHEAIRPSDPKKEPDKLTGNQKKLYTIIWQRFIACQMAPAIFDSTKADIEASTSHTFRATGQIMKFAGFLRVYPMNFKESEIPELKREEPINLKRLTPSQHFTQPPPRYTEASLVKELEKNGIGRPSTYATIISTIQARNYVLKNEQKRLYPTEIGTVVNKILVEHFPRIVDLKFTAGMEEKLDKIAEGKFKWTEVCEELYTPFARNLEKKYEEVSKKEFTEKPTGRKCPRCGSELFLRLGRFGRFYACSNFPECKYTEPLEDKTLNIKCPKCQKGEITEKRTKKGKIFYGCNRFPKCDFALWDKPTGEKCPKCGSLLVEKGKKIKCSNKDCDFEKDVSK